MNPEETIQEFYNAFANGDADGMVKLYHPEVVFEDPAFGVLKGDDARNMWQMLIERGGGNLKVSHRHIQADGEHVTADWRAEYPYGPKKRPVVNHVKASFLLRDGLIISHTDRFDLWKWSRQALGPAGLLLGWSGFMRKKIQGRTNALLRKYSAEQASAGSGSKS